jgi:hypothetical protein
MPTIDISAGTLPPPTCYASEQDRLDAYAAALIGNLNTGAEWASSQTVPGNPGLYWLRTDISNRPVEVLKFSSAAGDAQFIRLSSEVVFAGTASGAAGAYAVINSPPYPSPGSAYRTGQIYTFLANHTNAGACTLNVDGQGAKTITKDATVALSANDILTGQVVSVLYDGVNFQLLSQKRDLTRLSLKQFLTYASPGTSLASFASDVLVAFPHGFVNPISGVPLMPFMVRVVLVRTAAGSVTFGGVSGLTTYTWYSGQEVDCLHFISNGYVPTQNLLSFRYVCDFTNVWVSLNLLGNISIPFFTSAGSPPPPFSVLTPADYQVKVYATALNPAYVP